MLHPSNPLRPYYRTPPHRTKQKQQATMDETYDVIVLGTGLTGEWEDNGIEGDAEEERVRGASIVWVEGQLAKGRHPRAAHQR